MFLIVCNNLFYLHIFFVFWQGIISDMVTFVTFFIHFLIVLVEFFMSCFVHKDPNDQQAHLVSSFSYYIAISIFYVLIIFTQPLRSGRIWYKVNF